MAADGSIIIDTRIDTAGFGKGAANLKSQFAVLGTSVKKLGALIAAAFSVTAIVNFAKEAIELGSDLQEVQNVVDVTFTAMNEQINEFAKNAATTAGLSETMAKQYVGTFGAMAKTFQFTEEEAYNMSTALTQLAGDVASFYNITQDTAYTKLKSVFTGETESLKDLGVVMTQTALDDYALRKGLGKTTSEMTEQEKVALRYQFVLEQLSAASGDFIRTQDGWANQTRILSLQFDQLKATLGQGLINALTPAIKVLNQLIAKLQTAAEAFRDFTSALFGDAGDASSAIKSVTESTEEYGDAIEESAKQAKKAIAPFDEINKLGSESSNTETTSSVSVSASATGGGKTITADTIAPGLQDLDTTTAALGLLSVAVEGLKPLGIWLWDEFLKPMATWTGGIIVSSINGLADALTRISTWIRDNQAAVNNFVILLASVAGSLSALTVASKIVEYVAAVSALAPEVGLLAAIFPKLSTAIASVSTWISGSLLPSISAALAAVAGALGISVGWVVAIAAAVGVAVAAIIIYWDEIVAAVQIAWEKIKEVWASVSGWFDEKVIKPVAGFFTSLWDAVASLASTAWNTIKEAFSPIVQWFSSLIGSVKQTFSDVFYNIGVIASGCWEIIKAVWNGASTWFNNTIIKPISSAFTTLWANFAPKAQEAWNSVKNVFSNVATFFKDTFTKAWNGVVGVFSTSGSIFTNIKDGILTAFKKIVNAIIDGLNNALATPFNGINTALQTIKGINILGITPFSGLKTISVPKIPYLAKGAVIPPKAPFYAVLGDQRNGMNIEAPEGLIRSIFQEEMADMVGSIGGYFGALIEENVRLRQVVENIEVGDTTIGQAANRYNRKMAVITGGYV